MLKSISLAMSFLVGFLSLSQEILWVRLLGFLTQGVPNVISIVLSCFLLGIAVGAIVGKRICCHRSFSILWVLYLWSAIAATDFIIPEALLGIMASDFYMPVFMVLILFAAALKATIFPIAHHLFTSANEKNLGQSLSYVYLSNILGSTLGPLLTGFFLLDVLSLFDVFRVVAWFGLLFAVFMAFYSIKYKSKLALPFVLFFLMIFGVAVSERSTFYQYVQMSAASPVVFMSENRQGIIHVAKDEIKGNVIYGGNTYDGRTNISLINNSNLIDRVFLLSALHPKPEKVLVIGLSGGAWVKVLSGNKDVEKIDVIEINPGYLNYIKTEKAISSILDDNKVTIHIGDGRRWLRKPEVKRYYDLIVVNNTFHWRSYSTNLLSKEMMELVKSSLAFGGIYAFNTTGSADAHLTAAAVFSESHRWSNFVYSSDVPFVKQAGDISNTIRKKYSSWKYDDLSSPGVEKIFESKRFISIDEEKAAVNRSLEVITDENMIVEYKYGL